MSRVTTRKPLCGRYEPGRDESDRRVGAPYLTVGDVDVLPRQRTRDDHVVQHGYAVHLDGLWFFFPDIEPALAFGRAGRMSTEVGSYGVFAAVREVQFCDRHGVDEAVLLCSGDRLDRKDNEVEMLHRFVQGVSQRRGSAHWHPPARRPTA